MWISNFFELYYILNFFELEINFFELHNYGANCTVLRAVVLTQYRRVTDRRTDGIAVANTALAMRAFARAVMKPNSNS